MKKNVIENSQVAKDLTKVGIFKLKNKIVFSNKTRDRNVKVLKDKKSGVIFIPEYKSNIKDHYRKKIQNLSSIIDNVKIKNKNLPLPLLNDDLRRFNYFKNKITNKKLLDFGCGKGIFLSLAKKNAKSVAGLEISRQYVDHLRKKKFKIYDDINLVDQKFDIITLFHVLEHIPDQIDVLKNIKKMLKKKGKLIIEVPSANDVLFNLKAFRNFSLWSEHLTLHTKLSLSKYLKIAGYKVEKIQLIQRYNFINHFKWFLEGKPEGHATKNHGLYEKSIIEHYNKYLIKNEIADTILVEAIIQ